MLFALVKLARKWANCQQSKGRLAALDVYVETNLVVPGGVHDFLCHKIITDEEGLEFQLNVLDVIHKKLLSSFLLFLLLS
jgi:hypothetical protein